MSLHPTHFTICVKVQDHAPSPHLKSPREYQSTYYALLTRHSLTQVLWDDFYGL